MYDLKLAAARQAVPFKEASFSAAFEAAVGPSLRGLGLLLLILRQGSGVAPDSGEAILRSR